MAFLSGSERASMNTLIPPHKRQPLTTRACHLMSYFVARTESLRLHSRKVRVITTCLDTLPSPSCIILLSLAMARCDYAFLVAGLLKVFLWASVELRHGTVSSSLNLTGQLASADTRSGIATTRRGGARGMIRAGTLYRSPTGTPRRCVPQRVIS